MKTKATYAFNEYKPLYNRKDYHVLYNMSMSVPFDQMREITHSGAYRDKRIQRTLICSYPKAYTAMTCPLDEVPLHINDSLMSNTICKWRLTIAK